MRIIMLAVLVLVGAGAADPARADQGGGASLVEPDAPEGGPASATRDDRLRLRLTAPFASPRNSYFYSTLGVPLLRDARTAGEGVLTARIRGGGTRSTSGGRSRFDGIFWEYSRVEVGLGLTDRIDLYAVARVSGWDERRDVFKIYDTNGQLYVEGEHAKRNQHIATSRHENLSDLRLGALGTVWRSDDGLSAFSVSAEVKFPPEAPIKLRRKDLTNSGTTDLAVTAHLSWALRPDLLLHANAGVVVPFGDTWLFESRDLEIDPFLQASVGVSWAVTDWLALGASIEGASTAFDNMAQLHGEPVTASAGARLAWGPIWLEAGGGYGLTSHSADTLFWIELGFGSDPLWGEGDP